MGTKIQINLDAIMKDHNIDNNHIVGQKVTESNIEPTISFHSPNKDDENVSIVENDIGTSEGNTDENVSIVENNIGTSEGSTDELLDVPIRHDLVEKIEKSLEKEIVEIKSNTGKNNLDEKNDTQLHTIGNSKKKKGGKKKKIVLQEDENDIIFEEENGGEEKKVFITLDSIQKNNQVDISDLKNKLVEKASAPVIEKQVENKEKQELFSNYEAAFAKKKDSIMEKIKKLKSLPKTRPLFVSSLIIFTIAGIGLLFYIDPENHSIENYKTSIINIIDKNNLLYDVGIINDNNQTAPLTYEKKKIQVGGLKFEIETEIINDRKIFKYNGKTYNSDMELKRDIMIEAEKIKKEKLIEELIKYFK